MMSDSASNRCAAYCRVSNSICVLLGTGIPDSGETVGTLLRLKTKSIIESKANGGKRPYVCIKKNPIKKRSIKRIAQREYYTEKILDTGVKDGKFSHIFDKNMKCNGFFKLI
jgi:hypothetical protein